VIAPGPAAPASTAPTPAPRAVAPLGPTGQPPGSIVIPNGNGTSTVVRPDGTVDTIPSK